MLDCTPVTQDHADAALTSLAARLPSTRFVYAEPSEICGLVRVVMASGSDALLTPDGVWLILGAGLNLDTGKFAGHVQQTGATKK